MYRKALNQTAEGRIGFSILILILTEKLLKSRRRWEDNTRTDFKEIGVNIQNMDSAKDRNYWKAFVNATLSHKVS